MRYVNTDAKRPKYRINLVNRITSRLQFGAEWNPGVGEVNPVANWVITPESKTAPMVNIGTSSDRIFSPKGTQAVFVTAAKGFPEYKVAPYVSLSYSGWEKKFIFPVGMNFALDPKWDILAMNDGRNSHVLLTYKLPRTSLSALLVKMRYPGVSLGFAF